MVKRFISELKGSHLMKNNIKPQPNHNLYLKALRSMTPEQQLVKAFELSSMTKELFLSGLKKRFSTKSDVDIKKIYLERIAKCHNRNY